MKIEGGKKQKSDSTTAAAPSLEELVRLQNETIATLKAALEAKSVQAASGKQYAPSITTVEQARSLSAENLRDLAHKMVKVIPNSPATSSNPYGTPVLIPMKGNSNAKMADMKQGLDRGDFINLRKFCETLKGDFFSYREPASLTDAQVKGILCPILDRLGPEGAKLFTW